MQAAIEPHGIDLICLAGFMRLLTPWFIGQWERRLLNIHPALLPAFKGLDTHARAIAAGAKQHGATVHFVVPEMDSGPIIAQEAVPVLPDDTEATLAARVLAVEHRIYPQALRMVAEGRARPKAASGRNALIVGSAPADVRVGCWPTLAGVKPREAADGGYFTRTETDHSGAGAVL